jgi:signal transduction histidine kinase
MDSIAPPPTLPGCQASIETALADLEERLAQLQSQVHRLHGLATMGTLTAAMAHEINNLLTPLSGRCQFALREDDPKRMRDALDGAVRGARQIAEVCDRILAIARSETTNASRVRIAPVIEEAIACLGRDLAKDAIELHTDVDANLFALCCPASLRQVLLNLILNSRQAMTPGGGRLSIRAGAVAEGKTLQVDIADTGGGIAPEVIEKVFDPYVTTRSSIAGDGGAGLGLYVSRQLIEKMGGRISVESTRNVGATFRITLPCDQRDRGDGGGN